MEPLDMIALYVVATWLLERGFSLSPTWDYTAPECVRDYGPYRIWTIQGNVSPEMAEHLNLSALKDDLREYLEKHSALPGAVKFQLYNIDTYGNYLPANGDTPIYVSIFHI